MKVPITSFIEQTKWSIISWPGIWSFCKLSSLEWKILVTNVSSRKKTIKSNIYNVGLRTSHRYNDRTWNVLILCTLPFYFYDLWSCFCVLTREKYFDEPNPKITLVSKWFDFLWFSSVLAETFQNEDEPNQDSIRRESNFSIKYQLFSHVYSKCLILNYDNA